MEHNELIRDGNRIDDRIIWHQIVRNKAEAKLKERAIPLLDNMNEAVSDFAEFCIQSGGDRYTSVGTALNEISTQSKGLSEKVYLAEREEEVEAHGAMLDRAISLFKALESYYVHLCGLRTGTD
jgi:hypothetical protein